MKLWVDDIRNAPDDTWTVARTASSAIRAIARFNFDVISLDHDISHQVAVGSLSRPYPCEETFQAVAYFIAEKYWTHRPLPSTEDEYKFQVRQTLSVARPLAGPKVIIHSSNPTGGAEMAKILSDSGIRVEMQPMGAVNRLENEVQ